MSGGENVYAKMVWQKRFNNVDQIGYLAPTGGRVFAVGIMGSVTIDIEDVPFLVSQLRGFANLLEGHYRENLPAARPVQPARTRETRRGKGSGGKRCQQPSTRNATGPEAYTTCDTPLTESDQCANAGKHVVI